MSTNAAALSPRKLRFDSPFSRASCSSPAGALARSGGECPKTRTNLDSAAAAVEKILSFRSFFSRKRPILMGFKRETSLAGCTPICRKTARAACRDKPDVGQGHSATCARRCSRFSPSGAANVSPRFTASCRAHALYGFDPRCRAWHLDRTTSIRLGDRPHSFTNIYSRAIHNGLQADGVGVGHPRAHDGATSP